MARMNDYHLSSEHNLPHPVLTVDKSKPTAKKAKKSVNKKTKSVKKMDETEYLMSSKENAKRIDLALKSKKGTTYKNLEEFRRAYRI